MRAVVSISVLAGTLLLTFGCSSSPNQGVKSGDGSSFAARFEAAKAIGPSSKRDPAHAKLAEDAAKAGEVETVKKCLREIGSFSLKDDTAYKSALSLGKASKADAATEVAKSIGLSSRRDEALSKLAKSDYE